ncbi:hypothetical protein [Neobacillus mesonae]|uniref:hypothetical protein n=1 Tax=Neobacillus mesonae TaxID=1193713 RepID=UPI002573EEA1|nr:hypothetical protein [Neobacillus mesonae]
MNREQRNQLFIEARNKELTLTSLSVMMGCSTSMLSKYFSHKANLSSEKEQKLIRLIHQAKQFEWRRVAVE